MSCNTKTSLAAVIDAVNAQLNNNYVDRDDPRINQGVFTEPTIRGGLMLDEAAKLDFCGYVTECGQREPFGKQWVDRPLYPYNTLVSYDDGGEIKSRWQDIDDVVAGTEIGESYIAYEETRNLGLQGYTIIDSFELGATLTQRNQALRHTATGKLYRWAGDLPKTIPASSTPANSGGIGENAWLDVSDTTLRQQLSALEGVELIKDAVGHINNISELDATKSKSKTYIDKDGSVYVFNADDVSSIVASDNNSVFFKAVSGSGSSGAWQKISGIVDREATILVGESSYYKTISSALLYLSNFRVLATNNAVEVTLMLESGFIMAEQVYLKNVNLGWVTIKSVDAKVMISSAAMAVDYYPLEEETIPAAFMVDQAVGATIGTAFEADDAGYPDSRGFDGMHAKEGSSVLILADCGFSNCKRANLFVTTGSIVNAENGFFDSKRRTSYGVYAKFGGHIVAKGATVINSVRHNIRAQRDSGVSAEFSKTGGQKEGGSLYASSNSVISAPFCIINNAGELQTATAVYAGTNGKVDASESVISGTSGTVAKAVNGGQIDLYDTKVSGIAYQGFEATAGSISAHMMRVTDNSAGSDMFLMAFRGGHIFTSGIIARGASNAVYSVEGSEIIALDCDFSNTTSTGVICNTGSSVNMPRGKLDNCGGYAADIKQGSIFNFEDGSAINCATGGVYMYDGSTGNLKSAILTPQTAGFGISIYGGCTVNARASTGVTSPETHNTVTSDGVIYKQVESGV